MCHPYYINKSKPTKVKIIKWYLPCFVRCDWLPSWSGWLKRQSSLCSFPRQKIFVNLKTQSPVLMVIITIILKDIWGLPIRLADQRRRSEDYHSGRQAQCLGGDACCCNDVENVIFIKYLDSIDLCAYSMAQIFVVTPHHFCLWNPSAIWFCCPKLLIKGYKRGRAHIT